MATGSGRLDNKIALITGGGSGIGAATARMFAAEGARVLVTDLDEPAARSVAEAIGEVAIALRVAPSRAGRYRA